MKKTYYSIVILIAAGLFLSACGVIAAQAGSGAPAAPLLQTTTDSGRRTLSVSGTGRVTLAPDVAYVTIGIRTQNVDAREAVELNNQQTGTLIDELIAFGVAKEDIQTSSFNIYSFEDFSQPFDEKPPLVYSVENSVHVTVRDLDTIGELLSTAVDAGANNIWGVQFDVLDKSEAISQAREAAVADARAQADELATLAGVELGEIVSLSSFAGFPAPLAFGQGGGGAALEAAAPVPVSPGLITISVDVSVVFEIN